MLGDALRSLIGKVVSRVVFVEDYFQLEFGNARLSLLSDVRVQEEGGAVGCSEPRFKEALSRLAGSLVSDLRIEGERVVVRTSGGSIIAVLSDEPSYPEQLTFTDEAGRIWVT